jgi:hypothetical protein
LLEARSRRGAIDHINQSHTGGGAALVSHTSSKELNYGTPKWCIMAETKRLVKVSVFYTKKAGVSDEEFHKLWSETYGPEAVALPIFQKHVLKYNQVSLSFFQLLCSIKITYAVHDFRDSVSPHFCLDWTTSIHCSSSAKVWMRVHQSDSSNSSSSLSWAF